MYFQKITIIKLNKPIEKDLNKDLQSFSNSLGLFNERDKEKSCFRVFIELIKATRRGKGISSNYIADRANLSRGTVVHHLNKLMDAGIIIPYKGKYLLRVRNLRALVKEVRQDLIENFKVLEEMAQDLDDELKLLD